MRPLREEAETWPTGPESATNFLNSFRHGCPGRVSAVTSLCSIRVCIFSPNFGTMPYSQASRIPRFSTLAKPLPRLCWRGLFSSRKRREQAAQTVTLAEKNTPGGQRENWWHLNADCCRTISSSPYFRLNSTNPKARHSYDMSNEWLCGVSSRRTVATPPAIRSNSQRCPVLWGLHAEILQIVLSATELVWSPPEHLRIIELVAFREASKVFWRIATNCRRPRISRRGQGKCLRRPRNAVESCRKCHGVVQRRISWP